jgi:hypothetical protein
MIFKMAAWRPENKSNRENEKNGPADFSVVDWTNKRKVRFSRWPPGGQKIGRIAKMKKTTERIAHRYPHIKFQ